MYPVILSIVAVLSVFGMAATPAMADDISTCNSASGDDAIEACGRLIRRNPKDVGAFSQRGIAYSKKDDWDRLRRFRVAHRRARRGFGRSPISGPRATVSGA